MDLGARPEHSKFEGDSACEGFLPLSLFLPQDSTPPEPVVPQRRRPRRRRRVVQRTSRPRVESFRCGGASPSASSLVASLLQTCNWAVLAWSGDPSTRTAPGAITSFPCRWSRDSWCCPTVESKSPPWLGSV